MPELAAFALKAGSILNLGASLSSSVAGWSSTKLLLPIGAPAGSMCRADVRTSASTWTDFGNRESADAAPNNPVTPALVAASSETGADTWPTASVLGVLPNAGVGDEGKTDVGDEVNGGVGDEVNGGVGDEVNGGVGEVLNAGVGNELVIALLLIALGEETPFDMDFGPRAPTRSPKDVPRWSARAID